MRSIQPSRSGRARDARETKGEAVEKRNVFGWISAAFQYINHQAGMHGSMQARVSPTVISGAMIAFSCLWVVSAWVFYVSNQESSDGVFGAPLWALLFLLLVPMSNLMLAPCLVRARWTEQQRLKLLDYCALVGGAAIVVIVGAVFLMLYYG